MTINTVIFADQKLPASLKAAVREPAVVIPSGRTLSLVLVRVWGPWRPALPGLRMLMHYTAFDVTARLFPEFSFLEGQSKELTKEKMIKSTTVKIALHICGIPVENGVREQYAA